MGEANTEGIREALVGDCGEMADGTWYAQFNEHNELMINGTMEDLVRYSSNESGVEVMNHPARI